MRKILLIFIIIIPSIAFAQIKFTASAKEEVVAGEIFTLSFSVNANGKNFNPPNFENFTIISGPNTSVQHRSSYVNGRSTQSITNSFSYYLQADKTGTYTIPAATITVDKKKYKSNSLTIKVVKSSDKTNKTENGFSPDDLFLRVDVSKTKAYIGEHIVASVNLYTRIGLNDFNVNSFPAYTGFWTKEISNLSNITSEKRTVNGKEYDVVIFKKDLLYPQKAGQLTIEPADIVANVNIKNGKTRDFWGNIVDKYIQANKTLKSPNKTITIIPLPSQNKPENFSQIIGKDISFSAIIDKTEVKTEEGINLKITISGNANIGLLDKFEIKFPKTFDKYDPEITENIKYSVAGSSGSKTFEYLLIPQEPGKFTIPAIEFSYFDTDSKTYKTIKSDDFNILVEKSDEYSENKKDYTSQNSIETIGNDIKFIKEKNPKFKKNNNNYVGSFKFYFWYIISLLIFIIVVVLKRKNIKENADVSKMKIKKANKISQKRLKTAKKHLLEKDNKNFYKEITQAIWGYIGNKLSLPAVELTKDKIKNTFEEKNIQPEISEKLINLLDTCEYAQYSPATEGNKPENIYSEAKNIIEELEKIL